METSLNDMSGTNGLNEENLSSLKGMLHQLFHLEDKDLRTYSPLTLAYIGDGVYELVIRTILVKKGNCPVNQLHRKASSLVKAGTQSSMMEVIEPMLTEEEHSVYRRGRNAHSPTMAKHATMADYRRATGFEALMGYLYLKDDFSRIIELVRAGSGEDKKLIYTFAGTKRFQNRIASFYLFTHILSSPIPARTSSMILLKSSFKYK